MTIENFVLHLEGEFEDILPGTLKPDSHFREVFNWNSINAVVMMAMVKTEYDVTLSAEDVATSNTIDDLFQIIKWNNRTIV